MFPRKIIYSLILFLLAIALILGGIIYYSRVNKDLEVILFDVGQGDAILIQQGNQQIVIDGGRNGRLMLEKLGRYVPFWDRQIEAVVPTHPDADHIGGLIETVRNYRIKTIISTKAESSSQTYLAWKDAVDSEKAQMIEAAKGVKISFESGAVAEIIHPFLPVIENGSDGSNESSVAVKLTYGENIFFFSGDLPADNEEKLEIGDIDFLKVSHHGSKYSTSEKFLEMIKPDEAIISVGKNNTYGHPAPEVIERLEKNNIKIIRTDEAGDIIYRCLNQTVKCQVGF